MIWWSILALENDLKISTRLSSLNRYLYCVPETFCFMYYCSLCIYFHPQSVVAVEVSLVFKLHAEPSIGSIALCEPLQLNLCQGLSNGWIWELTHWHCVLLAFGYSLQPKPQQHQRLRLHHTALLPPTDCLRYAHGKGRTPARFVAHTHAHTERQNVFASKSTPFVLFVCGLTKMWRWKGVVSRVFSRNIPPNMKLETTVHLVSLLLESTEKPRKR